MNSDPAILVEGVAVNLLHLIILPTEACNFRCVYCYEDFKGGRMSGEIETGIRGLLSNRIPRLDRLDISWFGGEPLAAADIVLRTLDHIGELKCDRPELLFRSDITTNGYLLTPDLFERLVAGGVTRYQISFDGPPAIHDTKRVQANGKGTFDRIWRNLLAARETDLDFHMTLRLHVDRDNADACGEFLDLMVRDLGGDPRFQLFPRLLARWGGPNDADLCVLDSGAGNDVLDRIRAEAREKNVPLFTTGEHQPVCYASKGNSLVVRSDGRLNKCTIALEAEANQIGNLSPDGTVCIDPRKAAPWMRGLFSGDAEALHCPKNGIEEALPTEPADRVPVISDGGGA